MECMRTRSWSSLVFCSATQHLVHLPSAINWLLTLYTLLILHIHESTEKECDKVFKVVRLFYCPFIAGVVKMSLYGSEDELPHWSRKWDGVWRQVGRLVGTGLGLINLIGCLITFCCQISAHWLLNTIDKAFEKELTSRKKKQVSANVQPSVWAWSRPTFFLNNKFW